MLYVHFLNFFEYNIQSLLHRQLFLLIIICYKVPKNILLSLCLVFRAQITRTKRNTTSVSNDILGCTNLVALHETLDNRSCDCEEIFNLMMIWGKFSNKGIYFTEIHISKFTKSSKEGQILKQGALYCALPIFNTHIT